MIRRSRSASKSSIFNARSITRRAAVTTNRHEWTLTLRGAAVHRFLYSCRFVFIRGHFLRGHEIHRHGRARSARSAQDALEDVLRLSSRVWSATKYAHVSDLPRAAGRTAGNEP